MEIFQNIWLALNIVFGLWSGRNWLMWVVAAVFNKSYNQSQSGAVLDLTIPASCLAYYFTYYQ